MVGFTLMLFIYWGWDTAVSVNEETKDSQTTPGRAAVLSTLVLLATYALVILATQSYAGIGTKGIGLQNPANEGDVLSVLGHSIFGTSGFASVLTHLLLLMVLSSAAASTQTTILPRPAPPCRWPSTRPSPQRLPRSIASTSPPRCRRSRWEASPSSCT